MNPLTPLTASHAKRFLGTSRSRTLLAVSALACALLGFTSNSRAQGPYCPPNATVTPGTCICPGNTMFRGQMSGNVCSAQGQCVCPQGTWNGQYCVVAPPPPCGGQCTQGQICVNEACVYTGPLRFTLTWDQPGDMDLHVVTPNGFDINYRAQQGGGGTLDRDDRVGTGPENIYWPQNPPQGTYVVCVDAYAVTRPTNFVLQVSMPNGQIQTYNGVRTQRSREQCGGGTSIFVTSIGLGSGAPSYPPNYPPPVVQPPPIVQPPPVVQPPGAGALFEIMPGNGPARRETVLQFLGWDYQPYSARFDGNDFIIAPSNDWNRAVRSQTLDIVGRNQQRWSVRIEDNAWAMAANGNWNRGRGRGRRADVIEVTQWDQSVAVVRLAY